MDIIIVVDPHVHKYNSTLEIHFLNVCIRFWPYSVKLCSLNVVLFKLTHISMKHHRALMFFLL